MLIYLSINLLAVVALAGMIVCIGSMMSDCPQTGARNRVVAVAIATGYAAVGAGLVVIVAGLAALSTEDSAKALIFGSGFSLLCLGLGFAHGVSMLRAIVDPQPLAD